MTFVAAAVLIGFAGLGVRQLMIPSCPRCKAKSWDRKLCRPLLFCRKCATRVDQHGRAYN